MLLNRTVFDFHALPTEIREKIKDLIEGLLDGSGLLYDYDGIFNVLRYEVGQYADEDDYDELIEKELDKFFLRTGKVTKSDNIMLIEASSGFF